MRISKKCKTLCFIVLLCLLNKLMSFAIEPALGSSATMWNEYYMEEEVDTIFVGSSLCSTTFDPRVINEETGVQSFNMGTPMQAIEQSICAVETAIEDHQIDMVIFGMGFCTLQEKSFEQAELTFESARNRQKGGIAGFTESMEYILSDDICNTEKSINYWFPWVYNQEEISIDIVRKNITSKIADIKQKLSGEEDFSEKGRKGFRYSVESVDLNKIWEENSYNFYDHVWDSSLVAKFEELMQLCNANQVNLIVINTPHPSIDIVSCYELYPEMDFSVRALCEKYGVEYYDFSLIKPEIFELKDEYFYDYEHLNYEGAQEFSKAFSDFLIRRENGEDVEKYFYSLDEFFEMNTELLEKWEQVRVPQ